MIVAADLTPEQAAEAAQVALLEAEFLGLLANFAKHHPNGGREIALARTNLQQAAFWAVKGIAA